MRASRRNFVFLVLFSSLLLFLVAGRLFSVTYFHQNTIYDVQSWTCPKEYLGRKIDRCWVFVKSPYEDICVGYYDKDYEFHEVATGEKNKWIPSNGFYIKPGEEVRILDKSCSRAALGHIQYHLFEAEETTTTTTTLTPTPTSTTTTPTTTTISLTPENGETPTSTSTTITKINCEDYGYYSQSQEGMVCNPVEVLGMTCYYCVATTTTTTTPFISPTTTYTTTTIYPITLDWQTMLAGKEDVIGMGVIILMLLIGIIIVAVKRR